MSSIVKLVDKSDNCKHWTPQDALQDAHQRMEGRKVQKCLILWYEDDDNGQRQPCYNVAGLNREEHIAMLSIYLAEAVKLR